MGKKKEKKRLVSCWRKFLLVREGLSSEGVIALSQIWNTRGSYLSGLGKSELRPSYSPVSLSSFAKAKALNQNCACWVVLNL